MMRRGAVQSQCGKMIGSGVSFVLPQAILWVDQIPFDHQAITLDFCQDGGGRDRDGTRIAVNQRFLFNQFIKPHRIQQQIIGSNFQQRQSLGHCLPAGLVDIPRVDAARVDLRHAPC